MACRLPLIQPSEDTTPEGVVFETLLQRLKKVNPEKLSEAIETLQLRSREDVINDFSKSFYAGNRVAAFACSEALTAMGVPPAFRHSHHSRTNFSIEQKLDLLTYDIRWIGRQHLDHVKNVKYDRYRKMLELNGRPRHLTIGNDHHESIEYVFYAGRRDIWKIVSILRLPEFIQFECKVLHSTSVKKRQQATDEWRDEIFTLLREHAKGVRKTRSFTKEKAAQTSKRRFDLWLCSRMSNGSRTEIAKLYKAKTGESITPEVVARQLGIVDDIIRENERKK